MIKLILYSIITFTICFCFASISPPGALEDKFMDGKFTNENMFLLFNVMEHYKAIGLLSKDVGFLSGNFPNDDSFLLFNAMKHLRNTTCLGIRKDFLNDCLSNRDLFLNLLDKTNPITNNKYLLAFINRAEVTRWSRRGICMEKENFSILYTYKIFDLYYQWYISHPDLFTFSTPNRAYWLGLQNRGIFQDWSESAKHMISYTQGKELIGQLYNEIKYCLDHIHHLADNFDNKTSLFNSLKFTIYEDDFFSYIKDTIPHEKFCEKYEKSNHDYDIIQSFDFDLLVRSERERGIILAADVYPSSFLPYKHFLNGHWHGRNELQIIELSRFLTYEIWGYKDRCNMHINKETLNILKSLIEKVPWYMRNEFPGKDPFPLLRAFLDYRNSELGKDNYIIFSIDGSFNWINDEIDKIYNKLRFDYWSYKHPSMELIKNNNRVIV